MSEMSEDLEFEKLIAGFNDPEKFLARQIREVQRVCANRNTCVPIEITRKQFIIGASGVTVISGIIVGIYELFSKAFK